MNKEGLLAAQGYEKYSLIYKYSTSPKMGEGGTIIRDSMKGVESLSGLFIAHLFGPARQAIKKPLLT